MQALPFARYLHKKQDPEYASTHPKSCSYIVSYLISYFA